MSRSRVMWGIGGLVAGAVLATAAFSQGAARPAYVLAQINIAGVNAPDDFENSISAERTPYPPEENPRTTTRLVSMGYFFSARISL